VCWIDLCLGYIPSRSSIAWITSCVIESKTFNPIDVARIYLIKTKKIKFSFMIFKAKEKSVPIGVWIRHKNRRKSSLSAFLLIRHSKYSTQNTVPYCQKYTLTGCYFGDFAHYPVGKILPLSGNLKEPRKSITSL